MFIAPRDNKPKQVRLSGCAVQAEKVFLRTRTINIRLPTEPTIDSAKPETIFVELPAR